MRSKAVTAKAGFALVLAPLALAACGADAAPTDRQAWSLAIEPLPTPAGPNSGEPNLTAGPDAFYLSWLERTGETTHALRFARLEHGPAAGWGEPRTVMDRPGLFVNWADFPSLIALEDGTLAAHWLEKSGPGTYSYDVRMSISRDHGASWSDDIVPHRDGLQAEHGFVSLFPDRGGIGAVWLDGRATVEGEPMTLRATRLSTDGTLDPDELVDDDVCDCCQTGAAMAAEGPVVVYRDRTPDQIRDIYVTRRVDGRWTEPRPIHDDGWRIDACPVNGPAIRAHGSRVAVAWFTAGRSTGDHSTGGHSGGGHSGGQGGQDPGSTGRVLAAFSDDAGATFGPPVRVDGGRPLGRVDLELLDDGSALIAWVERTDDGAAIRLRRAYDDGVDPATTLTATSAARPSGFPRIARKGDHLAFAWTEAGETPVVRTAIARIGKESTVAQVEERVPARTLPGGSP